MAKDTWRERWDKLEPVHRVGSHSDDWGGSSDNLCFCEIKDFIQQEIDKAVKEEGERIMDVINSIEEHHIIETNPSMTSAGVKHGRAIITIDKGDLINNLK